MIENHAGAMDSLHAENRANASKAGEVNDLLNQLSKHEDTINGHLDTIDGQKANIAELQDAVDKHKQTIKEHGNALSSPWRIYLIIGEIFLYQSIASNLSLLDISTAKFFTFVTLFKKISVPPCFPEKL